MMSLAAMLNPVDDQGLPSPTTTRATSESIPEPSPPSKKQKIAKDAPIFQKGKPVGQIKFPPYETMSEQEETLLQKLQIYPKPGQITNYPRHIPYSSDKKTFLQKTGRDAFEVFQYIFKVPGDDRVHTVMWDYQIGLVRITPFFKCCKFPKTVPGKMLAANPGLKEVCHSITGGALAAQGYWMPFNAAKAIAATFCWNIRYALLPLFGHGFLRMCVRPESPTYQHMIIDRTIIEGCTREASSYRSYSPAPSFSTLSSAPHFTEPRYNTSSPRSPNGRIDYPRRRWQTPSNLELERRNGMFSPAQSRDQFSPRSDTALVVDTRIPRSQPVQTTPSPRTLVASQTLIDACSAPPNSPTSPQSSDGEISPKTSLRPANMAHEASSDGKVSVCDSNSELAPDVDPRGPEMKAAWMLWQLHMADTSMRDRKASSPRGKKRRASA